MKSALITGANKGIGLEAARQLAQKGYYIYLGSRNVKNGLEAVEKLKAEGLENVESIELDNRSVCYTAAFSFGWMLIEGNWYRVIGRIYFYEKFISIYHRMQTWILYIIVARVNASLFNKENTRHWLFHSSTSTPIPNQSLQGIALAAKSYHSSLLAGIISFLMLQVLLVIPAFLRISFSFSFCNTSASVVPIFSCFFFLFRKIACLFCRGGGLHDCRSLLQLSLFLHSVVLILIIKAVQFV